MSGLIRRVLLVNLFPPSLSQDEAKRDATEMYHLISTLGELEVVDMVHQRGYPAKGAYIGSGKALEVANKVKEQQIDIVVLNGFAKPRQLYELQTTLSEANRDIKVWDRIDLILEIFAKHAHTSEAKLQIKLAQMRHMGPRIYGMGMELSQQAGGIGTRGIGETNVELMKRHWRDAVRQVKSELDALRKQRERQIATRKELGLSTISIVGYTNAGKTTLYRRLAKKGAGGQNILFATLDSTVGKLYLPNRQQEVFVSDTIGFIKNLPPSLIEAFRSTLLESIHADVLLHVVDGSNPTVFDQFHVVEDVLADLELMDKEEIVVVNKIDEAPKELLEEIEKRLRVARPIFVSGKTGEGFDQLISEIERRLQEQSEPAAKKNKTVRIISHDQDEEYVQPLRLYGRGRTNKRSDWRTPEEKEAAKHMYEEEKNRDNAAGGSLHVYPTHDDLEVGQEVEIVEKSNQKTGVKTIGTVTRILSHNYSHPHGIKVVLADGTKGRVQRIIQK